MSEKSFVNPRDVLHIPENIELHVRVLVRALNRLKGPDKVSFLKEVISSLPQEDQDDIHLFTRAQDPEDSEAFKLTNKNFW